MNALDAFWAEIDRQLLELKSAKSADDVLRICPAVPGVSSGEGFFAGSGGDGAVSSSLLVAGWQMVSYDAHYYWCMRAPNGDKVTYVEGDLYRGNQMLPHGEPKEES